MSTWHGLWALLSKVWVFIWRRHGVVPGPAAPLAQRAPPARGGDCSLRIPHSLLVRMRADLERQHAFASERVGVLLARKAESADGDVLLARHYEPLREDEYLPDAHVGARITGEAIRRMLRHALQGECVFHVRVHAHPGSPAFSRVDEDNLHELMPSFCAAAPHVPHGALLLSQDRGLAWCWRDGQAGARAVKRITLVGVPMSCWEASS